MLARHGQLGLFLGGLKILEKCEISRNIQSRAGPSALLRYAEHADLTTLVDHGPMH